MTDLAECAELLRDTPACLTLLDAWQRWRGDNLVPLPDQVRPEELGRALSDVSILEAHSPDHVTIRLQGATVTELLGKDLTGEELSKVISKETLGRSMEKIWSVVSLPCGIVVDVTYVRPSGTSFPTRRLMLPVLSEPSDEPKRLYVAMEAYGEPAKPYDPPERTVGMLEDFTYVDIGRGAPE